MSRTNYARMGLVALLVPLAGACGAGSAAIISASGDSGSSGNALPVITGFRVEDAKTSPASVIFVLRDDEADPVQVTLVYELPGGAQHPLTVLAGDITANPALLPSSSAGIEYNASWAFEQETGIPDDESFLDGVTVFASLANGQQKIVLGSNAELLGVGNDAPVVSGIVAPGVEVDGIVLVEFLVSDTSDDLVDIAVEFDILGDDPDAGWQLARPAGEGATPDLAFENVLAEKLGTDVRFFWDTDVDLEDLEHDVLLRFTPGDEAATGSAVVSPGFRVDNNEEPFITLSDLLVSNPDERRGIPVHYTLRDEESDDVQLVFQWRRPGGAFPELKGLTPKDLDAILTDPVARRSYQVCSEFPRAVTGRFVPVDALSVHLPELASESAHLLAKDLKGRKIEILRPDRIEQQAASWSSNPLVHPVVALPRGDTAALILDRPMVGSWRLSEIDLATGTVMRGIVRTGGGEPSAMAAEPGADSVIVASDVAGVWQIDRVQLSDGSVTRLVTADGSTDAGTVRGIASLGPNASVLTVGSSLVLLEYNDPAAANTGVLLDGLNNPWGVVRDPLDANRLYLAERGPGSIDCTLFGLCGRVSTVDVNTLAVVPLIIRNQGVPGPWLAAPRDLAIERHGLRLVVTTEPSPGFFALNAVELGARGDNEFSLVEANLGGTIGSLESGPDHLRLLTLPEQDDLALRGGVEQKRTITEELVSTLVQVDATFDPLRSSSRRWRISDDLQPVSGIPSGREGVFVWDSDDVIGGDVFLRAFAFDAELGIEDELGAPKKLRTPLDVPALQIGDATTTGGPASVLVVDLDADGAVDLISANTDTDTLTVFFQQDSGDFGSSPLVLGGPGVTFNPRSVNAGDLDGDGDLDLVCANEFGDSLTIFFQSTPGSFDPIPRSLETGDSPVSVEVADLDADGDLDLVSANRLDHALTVLFQVSAGIFDPMPLELGGFPSLLAPSQVVAADIDGDGDPDLVSANEGANTLTAFLQTSPGSFNPEPLVIGSVGAIGSQYSVAVADLDGDGDRDLVSAGGTGDTLTVFFQVNPGTFAPRPVVLGGPGVIDGPFHVKAADVDGDGDLDLVAACTNGNTLAVFFQLTAGEYDPTPLLLGDFNTTSSPFSVAVADIDGDGLPDLVSPNRSNDSLSLFLQKGPGGFEPTPLELDTFSPLSLATADVDADGDLDLVSVRFSDDVLTVFYQLAPGVFDPTPLELGGPDVTNNPRSVAAADIDGDGRVDVVSANGISNTLTVFFQSSSGAFDSEPLELGSHLVTESPTFVAAADLDGDRDLDLVSGNAGNDTLSVFFQQSSRVFDPEPLQLGGPDITDGPFSLAAADLDGDDDLDLVSANWVDNTLTIFFQERPGVFDQTPHELGGSGLTERPNAVVAADLDGDGDVDIASANEGSRTLTIFFQQDPGAFDATPLEVGGPGVLDSPTALAVVDVDADGDLDLLTADNVLDKLMVFTQTRPGEFDPKPLELGGFDVTSFPEMVLGADIDGDGDPDIASANRFSLTIFWGGR